LKDIREAIVERALVGDGAMGTELQSRGLPADACQEQWNVDEPERVLGVHRDYLAAGADVLLTNTFGANRVKLSKRGLAERAEQFNRAGALLALQSAAGQAYVLGDVGPLGELIAPLGTLSCEAAHETFEQQIAALVAAGVHGIIIETMMSVEEAIVAVRAARQTCRLPVLVSVTFNKGKQGYRTLMGESVERATHAVVKAGADVVGTNCGGGTHDALAVITEMASCTDRPLLAEPNAGVPKLEGGKTVFKEGPDEWASCLPDLLKAGVRILGGCCGTTPEHIRHVRQLLDKGSQNT